MGTMDSQPNQHQSVRNAVLLWNKSRTLLIVSSLFGLGSLNVLTLVNDDIHKAGYNVLKAILTSTVADMTLSQILGNSPTIRRQTEVQTATKVLSDEKANLSASNKAFERKQAVLEKSHKEIEAKHSELKRISVKRAALVQNVTERVGTRSIRNAVKNVMAVPAEAIPFIGAATIVAMTTSDIYDDCQNLKDINELNIEFGHALQDQTKVCGMKVPDF
ncbi:MAG: hypothetical protein ACYC2E_12780 [Sulfuricella sp.]